MEGVRVKVTVSDVALPRRKGPGTFTVNGKVNLGSNTTAHIRTQDVARRRVLTLESDGEGRLRSTDVIPGVAHRIALLR